MLFCLYRPVAQPMSVVFSHYVNVSVLIKFSQKQPFYLNYHKFSIKSHVLDVY